MTTPYRMLCAIDGSERTHAATELVAALPHRAWDEVIVASHPAFILAARPQSEGVIGAAMRARRERTAAALHGAVARLASAGVTARGLVCEGEDTVDALLRTTEREHPDLVLLGSRGRGPWTSILLGSVARAFAIQSPVPVLIVRGEPVAPARILAAVDGSAAAAAGLAAFARFPHAEGTRVELLHVLPMHDWAETADDEQVTGMRASVEYDEEQRAAALLERARRAIPGGIDVTARSERGRVSDRVLSRAIETDTQLIVDGSRGASGPRRPFWGSTAERVATQAPCAVLIAPVPGGSGPSGD